MRFILPGIACHLVNAIWLDQQLALIEPTLPDGDYE